MRRLVICLAVLLLLNGLVLTAAAENSRAKFVQGDVNGDGRVNSVDYAMVKRNVLRQLTLDAAQKKGGDVNGDGKINAVDYMYIKRVVLKTGQFPHLHDYSETVVGNLHIFTCKGCGHQYEEFDGQLIG